MNFNNYYNHIHLPIDQLQELQVLSISYDYDWDHENGWWLGDLTEIQDNIGELKNLTFLDLSGNKIKILPASLGNLTNLRVMNLQGNEVNEFPNTFTKLAKLETLNVYDNPLNNLPTDLSNLVNLKSLGIAEENILSFSEFGINLINLQELTIFPSFRARMFKHLREPKNFNNFPKPAQVCLKNLRKRGCKIKFYL